jgi:hypothetical protein
MPDRGCNYGGVTLARGCSTIPINNFQTQLPGSISMIAVGPSTDRNLVMTRSIHEGGHQLGLSHSGLRYYGARPLGRIDAGYQWYNYNDPYDSMGYGGGGYYSASQRQSLGWLNDSSFELITPEMLAAGPMTVNLPARSRSSRGLKAVKIERAPGAYIWLEYSQPFGPYESDLGFSFISSSVNSNGIIVYYEDADTDLSARADLIDMNPPDNPSNFFVADAVLSDFWRDKKGSKIKFQVTNRTANDITVQIWQ